MKTTDNIQGIDMESAEAKPILKKMIELSESFADKPPMKTTDNKTVYPHRVTENSYDRLEAETNALRSAVYKANKQRDATLAALRQVKAILSQPCAIDSHGPKTLQILQGDCAIARQQIDAAIAASQGS